MSNITIKSHSKFSMHHCLTRARDGGTDRGFSHDWAIFQLARYYFSLRLFFSVSSWTSVINALAAGSDDTHKVPLLVLKVLLLPRDDVADVGPVLLGARQRVPRDRQHSHLAASPSHIARHRQGLRRMRHVERYETHTHTSHSHLRCLQLQQRRFIGAVTSDKECLAPV